VDDDIRHLVMQRADSSAILSSAKARGMQTLRQDGLKKVLDGKTTLEEVMRVTSNA
jgi:general secretion pathway protein E